MPEGTYRAMSFTELVGAFEKLPEPARAFRPIVFEDDPDPTVAAAHIYLAAVGPDEVSTCTALQPVTDLPIWDVNGYYRALGIGFPYRPTKRGLREAYQAVGGQSDERATYAFKRLLDKEFREHYDARPLGRPVDDKYRFEELYRMAAEAAAKQSAALGRAITVADILGEDVTAQMAAQAEAEKQAEEINARRVDPLVPVEKDEDLPYVWPYAYYLWGSRCRDEERLSRWQELLVTQFSRKGLSLRVAVGYFDHGVARAARVRHRRADGQVVEVLFLHQEAVPSAELAEIVVGSYHTRPYGEELHEPLYLH